MKKETKVVVGGTFDVLHEGHAALLKKGFSLGEITVGLTSNKMAEKSKKRKVRDFRSRKRDLENFLKKSSVKKYKIVKIEDKFGPTLKEDFDFIVVSPETYPNALLINEKRRRTGRKQMKIIKIKFVCGKNGKPISSTDIIKGRLDKKRKLGEK
jgi:pantetheine-phosphate adenylyltransferase